MRKVVIVGAGHVGSHCASALMLQGICQEIVMVDIDGKKAESQAMDLADAVSYLPRPARVWAGGLDACGDADIVVVAAGPLPRPDQTRLDTLADTIGILKDILPPIVASGFAGIFIIISNPADVVADYVQRHTGFSPNRVFSTGTALDSSRLKRILAQKLGVEQRSMVAYTMGEHGDSQMVPWSAVSVGGKPLLEWRAEGIAPYTALDFEAVLEATRRGGFEVLKGKGSTEFGIGAALAEIVKAIFGDAREILPLSVRLDGEFGQTDVYASVPAVLGAEGIISLVPLTLTAEEQAAFAASCDVLRRYIALAVAM